MKKLIPILLVLVLCLALYACGETPLNDNNTPTTGNGNVHTPTKAPTNPADSNQSDHIHNWTDATCTTAKFCTTCGVTEGEAMGHNWEEATCLVPKTCTACGDTEGEAMGHNWEEATCLTPETCTTCGETKGYTGECVYVETTRVEATKTTDGSVTYTCICGNSYEEILYAIGSAGLEYSQNDDGTLTVTGIGTCADTHVVIPQYFEGNKVTAIGKRAFYNCAGITEVTIPESITDIGTQIFYKCSDLHTVYYNSTYDSKDNAFLNVANIKTLVLGNTIPGGIIRQSSNIKEVILLDGITRIYNWAFYECASIENVVIPNSVTSVGSCAFHSCRSLKSITIPDSVTSIESSSFVSCESLTSVFIGNGVTSIERGTFSGCSSLTNIIIPNSVTSIGAGAFADCTSLTSIIIPNSVTSIGTGAFADCTSLRSVNIPDSITLIESETFRGCSSLANIVIPNSIDSMGDNAFGDCSSLTSVTIPDSVTIIGYKSFGGCSSLTNVTIPDSVISIGDDAFRDCTNLINIIIPDSISSFGNYVFRGCSNLTSVTFMNGIISIGGGMFFECGSLTSVTIPDSVTSIGAKAFRDCSSLVNIYFGGTMRQWEAISKGYNWDDGIGNYTVYCIDTPKTENLLANPSFEEQSLDSWILTEMGSADELQVENRPEDALKGNCCLHFYGSKADSVCFFVEQEVGISESGNYQFSISIMGGRGGKYEIYAYVKINGEILKTDDLSLAEYGNWDTAEISNIACEEGDVLTVGIYVKCQGEGEGAWGSIDDALLYKEN